MYIHKHICAVIRRVNVYEHIDIRIYKHTQEYMDKVYIWIIAVSVRRPGSRLRRAVLWGPRSLDW